MKHIKASSVFDNNSWWVFRKNSFPDGSRQRAREGEKALSFTGLGNSSAELISIFRSPLESKQQLFILHV